MDSTTPFFDRSLVTTTLDSGFDSCSASGNMSNINQSENSIATSLITENITESNTNSNRFGEDNEIESPSTTSDDNFKTNIKNNRTSSADSGSTFEIIDNSPPSPTSYQLVEDSPVNGVGGNIAQRNFAKLELNVPHNNSLPGIGQIDNRYRHDSQSSIKTCEANLDEERDTFSPISNNGYSNDPFRNDSIFHPSTSNNPAKNLTSTLIRQKDNNIGVIDNSVPGSEPHNLSLSLGSPLNLSSNPISSNSNNIPTTSNIAAGVGGSNSASGSSNNSDLDNKIIEKKKIKSTSTKEEKQRQNEEILIMETSSVSSETGSWESVFPHHNTQISNTIATGNNYIEIKDISSEKYTNLERENSVENQTSISQCSQSQTVTVSCPVSACFIDAASLLDESEVNNSVYPPTLPETGCFGPKPLVNSKNPLSTNNSNPSSSGKIVSSIPVSRPQTHCLATNRTETSMSAKNSPEEFSQKSESSQSTNSESWKKKLNLDKLETFHKSFELCKGKPVDGYKQQTHCSDDRDSNTSSCSSDSSRVNEETIPQNEENTNNLSDEEKLWKRENSKKSRNRIEVKDQFNKESPSDIQVVTKNFPNTLCREAVQATSTNNDNNGSLSSARIGVYEVNEQEIVKLRKEQERKQGNLVFQHNIQQFSGHVINPKIPFSSVTSTSNNAKNCNILDSNNFVEYSGSPAPSLTWSDIDCGTARYTHFDSNTDFGETSSNFINSRITSDSGATSVSCILPDTPNNSIVQIGPNTKVTKDSTLQYEDSDGLCQGMKIPKSRCDDLAPIVSGGASIKDFTPKQCESPPVRRKTETCPIVSGGFISLDLQRDDEEDENNISTKNICEKPKYKQQTWVVDMSDCLTNGKRRRSTSSSSSNENTARSIHSSIERNNSGHSQRSGLGFYVSLNDMEPPRSIDSDYSSGTTGGGSENISRKLSRSHDNAKKATGFYVDLSESENSRNATPPPSQIETSNSTPKSSTSDGDKKNIFSMFIDLGEKKILNKKGPLSLASRLSNSLLQKKQEDVKISGNFVNNNQEKSSSQNENLDSAGETTVASSEESRKTSLLITTDENNSNEIELNSFQPIQPAIVRRTQVFQKDDMKRHSWNNPEVSSSSISRTRTEHKEHKRSFSLSTDANDKNIMNILDKIPLLSKTSSMSIDSSLSPFDDITCSKTDLSTYSNNSVTSNSGGENEQNFKSTVAKQQKKRRRDVKINETFDKSSQGSITDGILSKDLSPSSNTTDTDDLTFQQEENIILRHESPISSSGQSPITPNVGSLKDIGRPTIMETIIETKETSSPKKIALNNDLDKHTRAHTMESLHATIEKQKMLLETVNEQTETTGTGAFVRLSDLDKPVAPLKFELHSPEAIMSKSVGNQRHINRLFQETTRNRPHSWAMTRSTGNSIMNITNSVENLRSLSRLFPHLSKEFSNSLPNDVYLEKSVLPNQTAITSSYQQRSPSDLDFINSGDMSTADSSLASSISRSALDESSISCRQPRRLGEDLLKMFLQEIGTDVVVEVNGRRIKAHKCILRSRCQYFAAMLAGGWVQSAGNVISLQGYSYSSVHFALCHIYSGACHPPDGISLMELAALADLLGLEGLKEVTAHALKSNYCHNFHKPCSGCIEGILQVLPVALNHALDDLYRKCLKWTCRHYLKVWPTRAFAQLPSEIFNRCRQQVVAHLSSESVLQTILDCDQLIAQIAHFRWAVIIENLLRDILDAAYTYISEHFSSLIASDSFLSLGNDKSSDIGQLENLLLRTASSLNPDQACRSYQRVTRLNAVLAAKVIKMPGNLSDNKNTNSVPSQDFGNILIVSGTEEEMEWNEEFIRLVSAILSAVEQCLTRQCSRAMRVTAWQRMDLELRKKIQKLACLTEPLDVRRNANIGSTNNKQQISFSSGSRNQDLYQVKLAIQAHSKKALEQDKQLYRATAHTQTHTQDRNTQTNEKAVQAANNSESNRNSTGAKITKSTSRVYVPQSVQTNHKLKSSIQEKSNINGHRRTFSEDSSISTTSTNVILRNHENSYKQSSTKPTSLTNTRPTSLTNTRPTSLTNRLAEVRPRYLEPRKPRITTSAGPIKAQTCNNLQVKNKQISSSDSSRNSSPATSRKLQTAASRKIGTKSINMSLDSLASPSKRSNQLKSQIQTENEISVDSLADSMRSSIITEKTVSHESLRSANKNRQISRSNPGINKSHLLHTNATNNLSKKPLNLMQSSKLAKTKVMINGTSTTSGSGFQNTSGSSPSSITNKSSRLSSVSSTGFSPRDAFKNRSISVPVPSVSVKKSFLSAKSREILARKAANLEKTAKLQESIKTEMTTEIKTVLVVPFKINSINKSNSSSNIPTRLKSTNLPQSIALRKKSPSDKQHPAILNVGNSLKNNQQSKMHIFNKNNTNKNMIDKSKSNVEKINKKSGKYINDIKEHKIEIIVVDNGDHLNEIKYESKLERSSTFCKETSDLPVKDLEIID